MNAKRSKRLKKNWLRIGDWTHYTIKVLSFNQAKKVFTAIRKRQGKSGCGCDARRKWLNNFGAKIIGAEGEE